jgi:hypothetical protein
MQSKRRSGFARRAGWVAFAAMLALGLLAPAAATSGGTIVIRGAASGSYLRIEARGGALHVHGIMATHNQVGCHFTHNRNAAVCPLHGASALEIDMGPKGDMVEILDKLPVGTVSHLGGGSDKMIANGEQDYCYSEGARRNRCVGGPGNDVCITGDRNSDCVGGSGNDFCKTGDGSDGCWGGRGDDVCEMGAGEDGCHGESGDDRLYGGPGADQLYGGQGHDFCDGGPGRGRSHECESGPGH